MKRYLPLIAVAALLVTVAAIVIQKKEAQTDVPSSTAAIVQPTENIGTFTRQQSCARAPQFLNALKIPQPVMIDLSQKRFKGIALLYGKNFEKVLHPRQWEQYAHLSTYTVDTMGNLYLIPTPYISIHPTTFNLQKNIYKLDSKTGKLTLWMHIDDIHPSANNPYGLSAITYDCDDGTLWAAAIDESDYRQQKGVIYHIDPRTKEILQRLEGVDALSLVLLKSSHGKYLLVGSARDNALYAYPIEEQNLIDKPIKLLELPNANEHIRKIKVTGNNQLELQSIPFSYTLIAQTAKKDRLIYNVFWNPQGQWTTKRR